MAVTKATFVCLLVCSFVSLLVPFETKKKKRKWQTDVHPRRTIEPDQSQSRKPNQTKKKHQPHQFLYGLPFYLLPFSVCCSLFFLFENLFFPLQKKKQTKNPKKQNRTISHSAVGDMQVIDQDPAPVALSSTLSSMSMSMEPNRYALSEEPTSSYFSKWVLPPMEWARNSSLTSSRRTFFQKKKKIHLDTVWYCLWKWLHSQVVSHKEWNDLP